MEETEEFSMSMGPACNQYCCGKPVGCNMRNPRCSFLHHRWKMMYVPGWQEYLDSLKAEKAERESGETEPEQ